jgi:hypothetical protein
MEGLGTFYFIQALRVFLGKKKKNGLGIRVLVFQKLKTKLRSRVLGR